MTYILGASLMVGGSVWLFSISKESRNSVYGAVCLIGIGIPIMLVTALAKTAELIGKDKQSGSFVYASIGCADKLSVGLVIFAIQALKPDADNRYDCNECEWFSKIVQSVVPGGFAAIGLVVVLFLFPTDYKCVKSKLLS